VTSLLSLPFVRSRQAPIAGSRLAVENVRPRVAHGGDLSRPASLLALTVLVVLSDVVRGLAAHKVQSPWILPDELVYSDLARSFAATLGFAVRGVHTTAYSVGYPVVLSAAFFHRSPVAAYDAARWLNAFLMSLAAIPAYLLARRLLSRWLSLLVAGLALLLPSFAYAGVLMTENAFYPLFLTALLVIVRALERSSIARQSLALGTAAVPFFTRAQGGVLVPVFLLAIALLALSSASRSGGGSSFWASAKQEVWRFRFTLAAVILGAGTVSLTQAVRGRPLSAALGVYASTAHGYSATAVLRSIGYHLVDLELYVGVLPFVPATAAVALMLWRRGVDRTARAVAAASAAAIACLVTLVGTIASQPMSEAPGNPPVPAAVHDRYLFYLAPIYFLFFVYWLSRREEFSNRVLAPLVAISALLPLTLPFAHVHTNADFEALALLPWSSKLIAARHVPYAMAAMVLMLSLLLFARRSSVALLAVGLVAVNLWFLGLVAQHEMRAASLRVPTSHASSPGWIDAAVPRGERVAVLWVRDPHWSARTTLNREQALWKDEVFNSSVAGFFYAGRKMSYDLPQEHALIRRGEVLLPSAAAYRYRYLLTTARIHLNGAIVARDRKAGLALYRLADLA
jgi:hypothetical protein